MGRERRKNLENNLKNMKTEIVGELTQEKEIEKTDCTFICDNCRDISGFYLGTTCPKCKRSFRDVKSNNNKV